MSKCQPAFLDTFNPDGLKIFGGSANPALTEAIGKFLGITAGRIKIERFPDSETIVKLDEDVRGRDCFIVQPTCPPVNENMMELLICIDCLRRASARRITAVIPYFGYARQDRKSEGRTPITAKLVANLISEAGADRVVAMDLHAEQIQGFFDIPVDHLVALPVIASHIAKMKLDDCVICSPDVGNLKRATAYVQRLGSSLAVIDKRRIAGDSTIASRVIGDVKDRTVLLFDDMITTAGTATEAVRILRDHGAKRFLLAATHPVLVGPAVERLIKSGIDWIVTCDTIPISLEKLEKLPQITVLSVASLLGEAIRRIHLDQSISELFKQGDR